MARLPRIDVVGVPQHIVVRGVDRQPCFFAHSDCTLYLEIVRDAASHCDAALHAYVLMTNHVHLLATGRCPGALSAMMQRIGLRYVRRINHRYARTGTLFEVRFRGSLVQSERYLLTCMRYIELNPVRARMVERPDDYPWSSYHSNAGIERTAWVTPHDEYMRLGASPLERAQAWRELVAAALGDDELASIRSHTSRNRVLGDDGFQREIAAMVGRPVHITPPGRPWPARNLSTGSNASSPQAEPRWLDSRLPVTNG